MASFFFGFGQKSKPPPPPASGLFSVSANEPTAAVDLPESVQSLLSRQWKYRGGSGHETGSAYFQLAAKSFRAEHTYHNMDFSMSRNWTGKFRVVESSKADDRFAVFLSNVVYSCSNSNGMKSTLS
jgi:hypothetical protein